MILSSTIRKTSYGSLQQNKGGTMSKWYGNTSNNIIGIPVDEYTPPWLSSTPPPDRQLRDLGRIAKEGLDETPNINYAPLVNEFRDYVKDPVLEKLLSGKKIAFVGPAPNIEGAGLGEKIDSYDLVVRINTAYDIPENLWSDYGKRTDIVVSCLNVSKLSSLRANIPFVKSLKSLIQTNLSMWDIHFVRRAIAAWNTGTPYHNVCDGYLFKINAQVGTISNTGLLGIITLLNYDLEDLYITGFNFFDMGENLNAPYNSAHLAQSLEYDPVKFEGERLSSSNLRLDIHSQICQIYYFGKIIEHHYEKTLQLDPYLIKNFKLWIDGSMRDKNRKEVEFIFNIDRLLRKQFNLTVDNPGENK